MTRAWGCRAWAAAASDTGIRTQLLTLAEEYDQLASQGGTSDEPETRK